MTRSEDINLSELSIDERKMSSRCDYELRSMSGLRVGVAVDEPYVLGCLFEAAGCKYHKFGVNVDFFNVLTLVLGFSNTTFVQSSHTKRHNFSDPPEHWQGLLGDVARHHIDLAATFMFVEEPTDLQAADFSLPVLTVTRGLVMKLPNINEHQRLTQTVIRPFEHQVWMAIIGVGICTWTYQYALSLVERKISAKANAVFSFFLALQIFFLFRSYKVMFYGSRVSTVLPSLPFTSLEQVVQLMEDGLVTYVSESYDSQSLYYINTSESSLHRRMFNAFLLKNPIKLVDSKKAIFQAISENSFYVSVLSEKKYLAYSQHFCNVKFLPLSLGVRHMSLAFQKGTGLVNTFNYALYNRITVVMISTIFSKNVIPFRSLALFNNIKTQTNGR